MLTTPPSAPGEAVIQETSTPAAHEPAKFAFIDALRGYAVLFVITSHVGASFADLPYPLKKLTNFGWHGVQLFFLISCVTLIMSWRSDKQKGCARAVNFWLRRVLRIAPMYYLAAVLYFVTDRPDGGFDFWQAVRAAAFVNAWYPLWTPTVPGQWTVVPGGWSIGVEFAFYACLPIITTFIRSMSAALIFFVGSVVAGCVANTIATPSLVAAYGEISAGNFLYFWFPNQLPVFALGTILYLLIKHLRGNQQTAMMLARWSNPILAMVILSMAMLANYPIPTRLSLSPLTPWPILIPVSMLFMVVAVVIAASPKNILINRAFCALGEVSFSVYLLHFVVVRNLPILMPSIFDTSATGVPAVLSCFALWCAAVPISFGLSLITFRLVEAPMIKLGRYLQPRRSPAPAIAIDALRTVARPLDSAIRSSSRIDANGISTHCGPRRT